MKTSKKNTSQQTDLYTPVTDILMFYEVLLQIANCTYYAYTPPYIHKTLPTLGNKKEQKQTEFYKKSSGNLIFLQATKNLKIIYFTCLTGWVLQNKVTPLNIVSSCKQSENFYKRFWRQTYKCTNGKRDKQKNR